MFDAARQRLVICSLAGTFLLAACGSDAAGPPVGLVIERTPSGLSIIDHDAAHQITAELTLRHGAVEIDEMGMVEGRELTIRAGEDHLVHTGFRVAVKLPLPMKQYPRIAAFLDDPAVASALAPFGVSFVEDLPVTAVAGEEAYTSTCNFTGCASSATKSCCREGSVEDRCCTNGQYAQRHCAGAPSCTYGGTYPYCTGTAETAATAATCAAGSYSAEHPDRPGTYACRDEWCGVIGPLGCSICWQAPWSYRCETNQNVFPGGTDYCWGNYDCRLPGESCSGGQRCCDFGGATSDCSNYYGGVCSDF